MKKNNLILILLFAIVMQAKGQFYITPHWVSNLPLHGEISAIGISDPRVPSDSIAKIQAEIRAKAIIAMLHKVEIAYTSEHFQVKTEEYRSFKLQEIIEKMGVFNARLPYHPEDFSNIYSYLNRNDEQIVLMGWENTKNKKTNVLTVNCEFYSKEYEISNTRAYAVAEIIELQIADSSKNGIEIYNCKMEFIAQDVIVSSTTNGFKHTAPGYAYNYLKTSDLENINEFDASIKLDKGIWQAYLNGLCHAMSEKAKNYNSKIKNLDDMYRAANETEKTHDESTKKQALIRQVVKNSMQFYLHGFEIDQNMLYIDISSPQLDEEHPVKYIPPAEEKADYNRNFWDWLFGRKK